MVKKDQIVVPNFEDFLNGSGVMPKKIINQNFHPRIKFNTKDFTFAMMGNGLPLCL